MQYTTGKSVYCSMCFILNVCLLTDEHSNKGLALAGFRETVTLFQMKARWKSGQRDGLLLGISEGLCNMTPGIRPKKFHCKRKNYSNQ